MMIRVAGAQMSVSADIDRNVRQILSAIDRASEAGAEILLTPEGSLSGYTHLFDRDAAGDALRLVTGRARAGAVGLALGTCFVEGDGKCYNQVRFYRPAGEYLGFHGKTLCCGSLDGASEGEADHYAVPPLRTFQWREGVTMGGLICNDMWADPSCTPMPDTHLSQQLARMGAGIVFHAVNGGRDGSEWSRLVWNYHESNLRMRARAGGIWIVTVDSSGPRDLPCSSPSGVVAPDGGWSCRTESTGERFFACDIDLRPAER